MIRTVLFAMIAALALPLAARAEPPRVAADILPVQALVARVMDGIGAPDLLIAPGVSPHHAAMRPSEARALADADLVFWVSEGLTPWLHKSLETLAADARVIELMETDGTTRLPFRSAAEFGAHDDHDHGHGEDAHEDHHAATGNDPHGWLDPLNGRAWLGTIAAELARNDPANGEAYAQNAADGQAEIDRAMARIEAVLAPVRDMSFVLAHDALQYFEARFGLQVAGAISLGDAAAPGPAHIAGLRTTVEGQADLCVLTEPQTNPALAAAIHEGRAVPTAEVDLIGLRLAPGPGLYPELLVSIAEAIASCR